MTEAEWLACADPDRMLEFRRGKASDRKLRLFAVACCRRIWRHIKEKRCRRAIEVAERFADGKVSIEKLSAADIIASEAACFPPSGIDDSAAMAWNVGRFVATQDKDFASWCAYYAKEAFRWETCAGHDPDEAAATERRVQSHLLRCIFGNPFHMSLAISAAVRNWNDGTVRRIAEGIDQERWMPEGTLDTGRLAILADALLDAGCEGEELLAHCRSEGPHVRGCWAIDAILGKS
jgi:hypothetical protein